MANFWSEAKTEPKRKFRYLLYFAGMPQFMAKTVTKPSFQVGSSEHNFLQHKFNFPGRITWQDVSITIVDPIQPDATQSLYNIIRNAGYVLPPDVGGDDPVGKKTITKAGMISALGPQVRIDTIGADGANDIIESWILNNPQITSVNFDTLDYTSDDILNIQIGLKYDWAELAIDNHSAAAGSPWTQAEGDNQ